jgi:hypothetical protein
MALAATKESARLSARLIVLIIVWHGARMVGAPAQEFNP